jgi:hypothetical protein
MENRLKRRLSVTPLLLIVAILLATMIPQLSLAQDTGVTGNGFTFVVTSDIHGYAGSAYDTSQYFRGVCEKIVELDGSSFMVSPGDLDPPSNVNWTIDKYLGQDYLWYPGVGNHNVDASDMSWLRSYDYDSNGDTPPNIVNTGPPNCVATTYSFDYENSHFVMLNEYYNGGSDIGTDGDVCDALYNWLAADLNATDKAHIFVFGHEPAYPQPDADNGVLRHKGDSLDKYTAHRDRFWNLLKSKNVVAYIHGHTHSYSAVNINGVWEIDSGHSMGLGWTQTRSTFIMIHVDGDVVTYETYRVSYNGGPYALAHSGTLATISTPPTAPSNLTATVASTTQINLSWQDNSSDETGFKLERKTGASGTYAQISTTSTNIAIYSDTSLSPGTTYYYRVRSYNANGDSAYSNEASATTQSTQPSSNLALNKLATADSEQASMGNTASKGNDGNSATRWCANNGRLNHWWKVDLGASYTLAGTKVRFQFARNYRYKIEVSTDNINWTIVVNRTTTTSTAQTRQDSFSATGRYVRITYTGLPWYPATWASHYEFEVYGY